MPKSPEPILHRRACHLCEAICGLRIEVSDGKILSIKGDPDDPLSRGHICPKAVALQDIHFDPDRLTQPMRRRRDLGDGTSWEPMSWHAAFDLVAEQLVSVRAKHGDNALAVYLGNPSVHNYGILTHQGALFSYLRTQNRYSATSVDQLPQHVVSLWLYGHKDLLPVPDIDRTNYMLMIGANPIASNGSIWTVPDVRKRIDELQKRDGKLVVIDPRRTETAELADAYYGIQPTTDPLFLAALLHTLLELGCKPQGAVAEVVTGLDTVREAICQFTPEATALATGIDAEATRAIARDFANADAAVCYGRMGVSVQSFGTLNHWLIQLINIVSGNFDRPGGALFTHPAVNDFAKTRPGMFARFHSRVSGKPEFGGELPAAALAEEILTQGEGQVRALFTCAGNPVLSTPNGRQLDSALENLEFMVSLDMYINETTRHADVILPPTSPLEHDHYDLAFHHLAIRNTTRFNNPVFDKPENTRHDWEIFVELGQRVAALTGQEARAQKPPAVLIDSLLKAGNYSAGSGHAAALDLATLKKNPSGIDLGPLRPSVPDRLLSENQEIRCDQPACLEDLQRAAASMVPPDGLRLIGRRHVRSNNSWMHNYARLVKGKDRSQLMMHPADMAKRGIADGGRVRVRSTVSEIEVAVTGTTDMTPGVVSLPHGFGHQRDGVQLSIAGELAGASYNDLTNDRECDPISGNAALNGTVVHVTSIEAEKSSLENDFDSAALADETF